MRTHIEGSGDDLFAYYCIPSIYVRILLYSFYMCPKDAEPTYSLVEAAAVFGEDLPDDARNNDRLLSHSVDKP